VEKRKHLNSVEIIKKMRDGTLEANDLDMMLYQTQKAAVEQALKMIPGVVSHVNRQAVYLKKLSTKFYEDHSDLMDEKPAVSRMIEQVEAEHPGIGYDKVLSMAAERTRENLHHIKNTKKKEKGSFALTDIDHSLGEL